MKVKATKALVAGFLTVLLLPYLLMFPLPAQAETEVVFAIPVSGIVDASMLRYLQRAFAEAEGANARAIILEIDTPGGLLSAAFDISDLIHDSRVPVYAYIRYNALSAGAFLALSAQKMYMAPGSVIGAAEPRRMDGQAADEKTLSAWEARMRSVTERQGKDPEIAAAMVRMSIVIPNLDAEDTLLTLTYTQAQEIGFIDGVADTRQDLLASLGLATAEVRSVPKAPAELLARFLTNPMVATLLLAIGMAAIAIAMSTGEFVITGSVGLVAFALFFGGHIFSGLAGREVIVIFLAGLLLLVIEAFIPSFGIIGLSGTAAVFTAVAWSALDTGQGVRMILVALGVAVLLFLLGIRLIRRSPVWSQIILRYAETKDRGYVAPSDEASLVGSAGIAITTLRPAGIADILGKRMDVVSDGAFIEAGVAVVVVKTEGTRIVVRPKDK
jgi:membrane-bound serine protease (ClpP class)